MHELAWNTKHLLATAAGAGAPERTRVEYHLLSWRELYNKTILTADRYSSGAAEWVVQGGSDSYTVTVASRPYYSLPQELCLSFDCFTQTIKVDSSAVGITSTAPPIEQVASEFSVLLSVFAREPLVPIGIRRLGDRPITGRPHYMVPPRAHRASAPPPFGIDSAEFISILKGFAVAEDAKVEAVIGAAKFYHAGLSLVGFDPSVAYVSLVSAVECLAGHHYTGLVLEFNEVEKFGGVRGPLDKVAALPGGEPLSAKIKEELVRVERFLRRKFLIFIVNHLPNEFWTVRDELYNYESVFPKIIRPNLLPCLKKVYDARSSYLHGGSPFPAYAEFGVRDQNPLEVNLGLLALQGKERYLPPFAWFERLTHLVIKEYMRRSFAPELVEQKEERLAEREQLLNVLTGLPQNVQDSLRKLTHWTARFLGSNVINPHAPNRQWADSAETVRILFEAGLIGGEGEDLEGSSWLKDREVGETAGEFVFGAKDNPFRGSELLLPMNWKSLFDQSDPDEVEGETEGGGED